MLDEDCNRTCAQDGSMVCTLVVLHHISPCEYGMSSSRNEIVVAVEDGASSDLTERKDLKLQWRPAFDISERHFSRKPSCPCPTSSLSKGSDYALLSFKALPQSWHLKITLLKFVMRC